MSERKVYCLCDANCKHETMTKQQIMTAIAQAISTGVVSDIDAGFITKVKENNGGRYVSFWVGTQAQYNAIEYPEANCLYIITDDTTKEDLEKLAEELRNNVAHHTHTADTLFGVAEIASGTYVGTGTFGLNNPNSLTFDFVPKILIASSWNNGLMVADVNGGMGYVLYASNNTCTMTRSGNTVTWYSGSAAGQMNMHNNVYSYVALG